jgi:hypothetical protein
MPFSIRPPGAIAITLAILNAPLTSTTNGEAGPQTRRWMMHHGGEPEYLDHRIANFSGEFVLQVRPD